MYDDDYQADPDPEIDLEEEEEEASDDISDYEEELNRQLDLEISWALRRR